MVEGLGALGEDLKIFDSTEKAPFEGISIVFIHPRCPRISGDVFGVRPFASVQCIRGNNSQESGSLLPRLASFSMINLTPINTGYALGYDRKHRPVYNYTTRKITKMRREARAEAEAQTGVLGEPKALELMLTT